MHILVVNRDHSSKLLSFPENRAFFTHFGNRRTDEQMDSNVTLMRSRCRLNIGVRRNQPSPAQSYDS